MLAYIIAALGFPNIPHPVLALTGEQGTAKSMITKRIVQLVDPSSVLVRKPPRDPEAWVTAAQGFYVVGIDNLSSIPEWLSDSLCRAVTGDGDVRRQLYTDGGLAVFAFRRCIVFNGIDVGALRGDLADRTMHVSLERISKRIGEKELEKQWSKDYPGILGACIAGVACVLGGVSQVGKKEEELPRMADFARILATVDDLLSTEGLKRYTEQSEVTAADTLTSDPFLAAVAAMNEEFVGTAADLRSKLTPEGVRRLPDDWPKSARAVTGLLKRNAPVLRKAGWTVLDVLDRHAKILTWTLTPLQQRVGGNPQPAQTPQSAPDKDKHAASSGGYAGNEQQQNGHQTPAGNGHSPSDQPSTPQPADGDGNLRDGPDPCQVCGIPMWADASRARGMCQR